MRLSPVLLLLLLLAVTVLTSPSALAVQEHCPDEEKVVAWGLCQASPNSTVCSGRGRCVCGRCHCDDPNYTGQFCECHTASCPRSEIYEGLVCGGPGRGVCHCGKCECSPGLHGRACDCYNAGNRDCIQPGTDEICSGNGWCECSRCRCFHRLGMTWSGQYCEVCPTCVQAKCESLRACAECRAFGIGPLTGDACYRDCPSVDLVAEAVVLASGERLCAFFTPEGCRYDFVYGRGNVLYVKSRPDCPVSTNITTGAPNAASFRVGTATGTTLMSVALLAAMWW